MTGKISAFSFLISFALAGLLLVLFIVFCPLGGKYKLSLISPFPKNPKEIDVLEPELVDLDNSGQKKLLLTLYCTFIDTARKQCLIDLNTRDVKTSPISGTSIRDRRFLFNLDQGGKMEVSGNIPIHGNTPEDYPFTDQLGWLMVCDHDLNFKFSRERMNKYSGEVCVKPLGTSTGNLLAVWNINVTDNDSYFR